MKPPLRIFLADLTYDTIAISTEAMPLNIGYIASYCIKKFGSDVEISLFKYISDLEKALEENPPDILGMSNYCWSQNVSLEMFKICKEKNPHSLRVWGGPNFPIDLPSQELFLNNAPEVDIYVPIDGEVGFSNVVDCALKSNSKENIRTSVLSSSLEGCVIKNSQGKLQYTLANTRIRKLDEIPSPYITGLMDKFFDGKLIPMLQTNRGCPFTCTFCTDGNDAVMQVNKFSKERVKDELEYIAEHVPEKVHSMFISDLNFGMLPGDAETCNIISELQNSHNFPQRIIATTGKNNKEGVINGIQKLKGSINFSMSVQSMDQDVLQNIRRDNISVDKMISLAPAIKESGLLTIAEIILCLPGENYQKHLDSIRKLVLAKLDDIVIHTCMLLPGSEMSIPSERLKYQFQTKFRILPRDFVTLNNGKRICEIEEVVVSTKDMTFDEYVELRILGFILWMTNKGILYDPIIKFLREMNVDVFDLFYQMVKRKEIAPLPVRNILERYRDATVGELFDSSEDIFELIQDDEKYADLVDGKGAINVMQFHHAAVLTECMDEWTDYVVQIANNLLKENNQFSMEIQNQFQTIENFCRGTCHNPLGENRMNTNPEFILKYDVKKWLSSEKPLSDFKFSDPINTSFILTPEQYKVIQDTLDMYGDTLVEKTKVLKMIAQHHLWRSPSYQGMETSENITNGKQKLLTDKSINTESTIFSV